MQKVHEDSHSSKDNGAGHNDAVFCSSQQWNSINIHLQCHFSHPYTDSCVESSQQSL